MVEVFTAVAVGLMILAVIGSFVPLLPAGLLSVAGILVYWWSTGYTRPELWFLLGFVLVGVTAWVLDYLSGVIAAKFGGASTFNAVAGGIVGLVLFLTGLGPLGLLIGVAGTVFVREFISSDDASSSLKAGLFSAVGVLGSAVIQFVFTLSLLVAFLVALLV